MSHCISQYVRELHAMRFSDREIADRLNDPLLHNLHRRTLDELDDATQLGGQWTKDDVRNLRRKLQLPGHRPPRKLYDDHQNLWQIRAWRRSAYAARWHHHNANDRLSPRMVDILDALHDHGPQTKAQLAERCRWRPGREPQTAGKRQLVRLVEFGLVAVSLVGRYHVYELSPGIKPYMSDTHPNHMTSVEARHKTTREERVRERYRRLAELVGC